MNSEYVYKGRIIAKKVTLDNIVFDSEMESEYYKILKEKEKQGEIKQLKIHERIELIPDFEINETKNKGIYYEPDFVYLDQEGKTHYIDVKGLLTDEFKIKKKLFEYIYKVHLELIVFDNTSKTWITFEEKEALKKARKKKKAQELKDLKNKETQLLKDKEMYRKLLNKYQINGKLTPKELIKMLNLQKKILE